MPNVMVALLNIGGAVCTSRKVWLASTARVPCSNAANIAQCKTWRKQSEFCTWQNSAENVYIDYQPR